MSFQSYIKHLLNINNSDAPSTDSDDQHMILIALGYDADKNMVSVLNTSDQYNEPIVNIAWTPPDNASDHTDPAAAIDTFQMLGIRDLGDVTPQMLYDQVKKLRHKNIITVTEEHRLNMIIDQRKYLDGCGTGNSDNPHWLPQVLVEVVTTRKDWPIGAKAIQILDYLPNPNTMITIAGNIPGGSMLPGMVSGSSGSAEGVPGFWNSLSNPLGITDTNAPWMQIALKELGQARVAGAGNNQRVQMYFGATSAGANTSDEVAWCSAFANWCVKSAGFIGTNSSWAKDWMDDRFTVPAPLTNGLPPFGAIAVFSRGEGGHVAFYYDSPSPGMIRVVGGNQGGSEGAGGGTATKGSSVVSISKPRSSTLVKSGKGLLGYRWPKRK